MTIDYVIEKLGEYQAIKNQKLSEIVAKDFIVWLDTQQVSRRKNETSPNRNR